MATTHPALDRVEYEALAATFRPIFDRIAQGAAQRESERRIAYEEIGWLRDAGFGAVRVPVEWGGSGATVGHLFRLLIELGEADSNLAQGLRAHFVLCEGLLYERDPERRERWLRRIGEGALLGNATTESSTAVPGQLDTELVPNGDSWLLNGKKYYSTGTLYADWIAAVGRRGDDVAYAIVAADAPGVDRIDDFGAFGQRLTASGTTEFHNVEVPAEEVVLAAQSSSRLDAYSFDFASLVLQAAQVGIARAVVRDAVEYVRTRTRVFTHGSGPRAAEDPLVQQVIGRLSGLAFAAESATLAAVAHLDHINDLRENGHEITDATWEAMRLAVSQAYITVGDTVLRAATLLFDVGGASAVSETRRLDRHWRNARTVANHNPAIYKERAIGDHLLNGTPPAFSWTVKSIDGRAERT